MKQNLHTLISVHKIYLQSKYIKTVMKILYKKNISTVHYSLYFDDSSFLSLFIDIFIF